MPKYKTIFSLRICLELAERGFIPLLSMPNKLKPGYDCWKFKWSPEFQAALDDIMKGGR